MHSPPPVKSRVLADIGEWPHLPQRQRVNLIPLLIDMHAATAIAFVLRMRA
jgi:hypothetical protein